MTIHQAKNREFASVLILWPMTLRDDGELQRRLLYNAVTRAKNAATVIVQDPAPTNSRLARPPFCLPPATAGKLRADEEVAKGGRQRRDSTSDHD